MKKNKKAGHSEMTHVDHDMFTDKDGYLKGGVEIEATKPNESQTVDVKGTRRIRPEKKPVKATWY